MSGLSSRMIAGWVNRTHQVPNADPHQPATPAFEIPTENLLSNYRPSSSAPFFAPQATTKQARRKRMPLEKEFGREQRNDYKYSHRQHTDALRAAAARPDVYRPQTAPREVEPERGRRMSRGPAPRPKSLGKHSLHHQMPGSDPYAFHYPHANHEHGRSASVQPSSRRFPGPMPEPWPNPGHEFGVPAYTQTNFAPLRARQQPTRSHTMPLLPPPASAPVNTSSQQYPYNAAQQPQYSRPHHSPNYSNSNPYASPSFSPPNSAPAFSGAYYQDQPVIPDPREFGNPKPKPFIQRMLRQFADGARVLRTRNRDRSHSHPNGFPSQSPSPMQQQPRETRSRTPTASTKTRWPMSPPKSMLTYKGGYSETLSDPPPAPGATIQGGGAHERDWLRPSLEEVKEPETIPHLEVTGRGRRGRHKSRVTDQEQEGTDRHRHKYDEERDRGHESKRDKKGKSRQAEQGRHERDMRHSTSRHRRDLEQEGNIDRYRERNSGRGTTPRLGERRKEERGKG